MTENPKYLSEQLITYLGNKRKLLPLIQRAIEDSAKHLKKETISFADAFAGSGVVARLARKYAHTLYINDLEKYSTYTNKAYHTNQSDIDIKAIEDARTHINQIAAQNPVAGFITDLYAPKDENNITIDDRVFYTRQNALFIDTARQEIDTLDPDLKPFLLAPLIQRASVHANTSGVFKGFYKNKDGIGQFGGTMRNALKRICTPITLPPIVLSNFERTTHISQLEAAEFAQTLPPVDLAYFDPPYNQHPYGSNYFMLNLILDYQAPSAISTISGIPKGWNKSDYNVKSKALAAFEAVLTACKAKILLVSYSSEGFISLNEMLGMLGKLGELALFDQKYNTFRGCRNLANRPQHVTEFLFKVVR